jgi:hypothetical protein
MRHCRMRFLNLAACVVLAAALPLIAQNRIEVYGRWSDAREGRLASVIVNCYRAAKTCTVVSTDADGDLMSNDHDIVQWDSRQIVAIGGGDCVTNTLVINLSRKTVSMSSASNQEHSGDGVCQEVDKHPDSIKPVTLIRPVGGLFLVY